VHCGQQKATIDRIAEVPDNMAWEQQVAMAQQQRDAAAALAPRSQQQINGMAAPATETRQDKRAECRALSEQVNQIDALARQGQSAQSQQQLRERRQALRDQQFRLGC